MKQHFFHITILPARLLSEDSILFFLFSEVGKEHKGLVFPPK